MRSTLGRNRISIMPPLRWLVLVFLFSFTAYTVVLNCLSRVPETRLCVSPMPVSGGAKVDHGSGGTVPLRRSKTLPVCEPFPVTGRVGRFIPWSCIARSVWRAGTG